MIQTADEGFDHLAVTVTDYLRAVYGKKEMTFKVNARRAKKSYPKLSVTIYMIMGWCAVLFLPALIAKANALFLIFIVLGGIMYTIGVIFYSQPKHPYFHFIWHLFINLASIFHFIALIFFI